MPTLNTVLDEVMKLDYESTETLLEIIRKRQIEKRRDEIARNARTAKKNFAKGKLKAMTADELIKELSQKKQS
ncbi:MAG: hypothetical protein LH473_00660 [Chitinophagales bacterium]|nr:hypothetical protein [Chitinophagales bacterium]